jgi:hypothetical protein
VSAPLTPAERSLAKILIALGEWVPANKSEPESETDDIEIALWDINDALPPDFHDGELAERGRDLVARYRAETVERDGDLRPVSDDRETALAALTSDGCVTFKGISLEVAETGNDEFVALGPGWAVFSGCEGEDPDFVSFFAGADGAAKASALVAMTEDDGEHTIFDGGRAPAFASEKFGIVAANHYDEAECIAALAELFGVDASEWGAL